MFQVSSTIATFPPTTSSLCLKLLSRWLTCPQRFKSAIDRTIAEEQARQQSAVQSRTPSRTASTSSRKANASPTKRDGAKKAAADAGDAANPDPAVFEAAFVIDDSDEPSRAGTPKPPAAADEAKAGTSTDQTSGADGKPSETKDESATDKAAEGVADAPKPEPPAKPQELTPEIRQKLRKLEKLEATYPGRLRYLESNTAVGRMLTGV